MPAGLRRMIGKRRVQRKHADSFAGPHAGRIQPSPQVTGHLDVILEDSVGVRGWFDFEKDGTFESCMSSV